MADRLYVFPFELLEWWQKVHGPLSPQQQKEFVSRPICQEIGKHSPLIVRVAVRRKKKLTAILDEILRIEQLDKSVIAPLPPRPKSRTARVQPPGRGVVPETESKSLSKQQKWRAADRRLSNPSDAERLLWNRLRKRQLDGFFFLREFAIAGWWVDFYCAAGRLVVEVDGAHHRTRKDKDAVRDETMRAMGYEIIRVPAARVFNDLDGVLAEILDGMDTPEARRHRDAALADAPDHPANKRRGTGPGPTSSTNPFVGSRCPACDYALAKSAYKPVPCPRCGESTRTCRGCGRAVREVSPTSLLCSQCAAKGP